MKKTALTLVALAFGSCVAFAQTTPQTDETTTTDTEQSLTIDRMSDAPAEAGRKSIKVEELPAAVQEQLASGEFAALKVVTVTEVQPQEDAEAGVQYEVALQEEAADAAAEPSLVVYFDEQGQLLSSNQPAAEDEEEAEGQE